MAVTATSTSASKAPTTENPEVACSNQNARTSDRPGVFCASRNLRKVSLGTGLASLCEFTDAFGAQAVYRRIDVLLTSPESLLRAKVTKTLRPIIRPRLRRGSLIPSPFQRPAAKGHPWPIAALAASIPLNLLHDDSIHPPGRALPPLNRGQFTGALCA